MTQIAECNIACPICNVENEQTVFHSINNMLPTAAQKIVNGEINFATCPNCGHVFQLGTGLLYVNQKQQFALYYHPNDFTKINKQIEGMKKMFGPDFFLSRPLKFTDWDEFIQELKDKEGIEG